MNISRPEFFQQMNMEYTDMGEMFDEVMALYNIVSSDYKSVIAEPVSTDRVARFTVEFESEQKATEVYGLINGSEITIYDKVIQIICWKLDGAAVKISIRSVSK